jgi:tetratricopeptide (TPR) repeat protein
MDEITIFFAAEAEEHLENGLITEAIDLCIRGLEKYPDYPLALSVLAKAYKMSNDEYNLNETINNAIAKFPSNKIIQSLIKDQDNQPVELEVFINTDEELKPPANLITAKNITEFSPESSSIYNTFYSAFGVNQTSARRTEIRSTDIRLIPGLNSIIMSRKADKKQNVYNKLPVPARLNILDKSNIPDDFTNYTHCFVEMNYDEIPEEDYFLSKARQIANSKPDKSKLYDENIDLTEQEENNTVLYTDTIASIYEMQGAYAEAIKVYEILTADKPEKKDYYEKKISQLKNLI